MGQFQPVLLLVLIAIITATMGHAVLPASMPLLLIAFLTVAVLSATRRPRPDQDR
jgi:hypothetical protein